MVKKSSDTNLQNLPACAVEFIRLVIKKMRYRKRVRQDVQAELSAHFEDELKDLAADEEKAQKAQQLIAGFGDVKLLAVLLRRAKKRCRPLWRTAIVRTLQTVVVLIVCLVIYVVWFLTGKPVITVDYVAELNRIVRPSADETQNAAPLYHKAVALCDKIPEDISELLGKKYIEATAEEGKRVEKWITDNEEILELVIAGSGKPYSWRTYEGEDMISVLLPHLSGFRNLTRVLCWRALLRAEQGRHEDAFGDIKSCYRFGQHLKGDKVLIEQLVGIAIEALAIQALRDVLSEHAIDSAELAALQQDFEKMIVNEDFTTSLKTEKMFMYDEIQRCFTEDRFGGGHLYLSRIRTVSNIGDEYVPTAEELLVEIVFSPGRWARAARVLFFHPDKQQTRETADCFYALGEKMISKTPAQLRAEGMDLEKEAEELIKDNVLLMILAPALSKVGEISHRNRADVEAALTIIAILRYKQDTGGYPQNLKQLKADDYLEQLPIDPFSDKPLVYKRADDDFVLYSVGPNFTDDGGESGKDTKGRVRKWRSDGDTVFWPVAKSQLKQ